MLIESSYFQFVPVSGKYNRAVCIGSVNRNLQFVEPLDDFGAGMVEAVVFADGDDGETRFYILQKFRTGRCF